MEHQCPPGMDPIGVFEALMQLIEHLGNQINHTIPPPIVLLPPPLRQSGDKLLANFRALRPDKFDGIGEPWRAEQWLREIEVILDAIECSEQDKSRLASF